MTETATNPVARQLIQQAEMISRLRHDLDELASEITDAYADMLSRLESLDSSAGRPPDSPAAWSWRSLGPEAAGELSEQLDAWVNWVRHRYPLAMKIPPCWADHPEIIEELTALWLAWQAAYEEPDPSLTAAADWHDRWLPGVLHRMEHGPFSLNCSSKHQPRPATAYGAPERAPGVG